jgi:epoxyqueuosine reductase
MMLTAADLKLFAQDNGIHAVGWFAASDFPQYLETIRERDEYHHIAYRPETAFLKAGHIPEGIRTVVVLVMDYFVETSDRPEGFRLSNYARTCWNTVGPKTVAMAEFLKAHGFRADNMDVPQRAAACRAGLGFIGRNAMFYAHGLGSYVGIASLGTDAVLEDPTTAAERVTHPRCEKCGRCVSACPVTAIPAAGYQIDPMRCLSMLNRHPDEPGRIMPQKPEQLERWIYGCETCQTVCPLNEEARHRHEGIVTPEIRIEGMTLPNTATVTKEIIESRRATITSPGYHAYIQSLLDKGGEPAGSGDAYQRV